MAFERAEDSGINTRCFDLRVKLTSAQQHKFQNLQKAEYSKIFSFLSGKNIPISGAGPAHPPAVAQGEHSSEQEDSSEDESFSEVDADVSEDSAEYRSDLSSEGSDAFEDGEKRSERSEPSESTRVQENVKRESVKKERDERTGVDAGGRVKSSEVGGIRSRKKEKRACEKKGRIECGQWGRWGLGGFS